MTPWPTGTSASRATTARRWCSPGRTWTTPAAAYSKLIAGIAALDPADGPVDQEAMKPYREKFGQQMGNDLNTSMGVTALFDVLKAKTNDATKLALIGDFDSVLSLGLLEKAAAKRAEAAQAKTTPTEGGYTVTGEGDPAIDALVLAAVRGEEGQELCGGGPHPG